MERASRAVRESEGTVEDHHLVLRCATTHLLPRTFAKALYENLEGLSDILPVLLSTNLRLQLYHLVETADFLLLWNIVRKVL